LHKLVPADTHVVSVPWSNPVDRIKKVLAPGGRRRRYVEPPVSTVGNTSDAAPLNWKDWVTQFLFTPDSQTGWIPGGIRACLKEIRKARPHVVYTTSPCTSSHLIGLVVSYLTRIPWVADLRDPWRGNPFRQIPFPSLDLWDSVLERAVLGRADHVICNTASATDALRTRRPFLSQKCTTILNAFDPIWFDDLEPRRATSPNRYLITHAGQFYGRRRPEPWFRALRTAIDRQPSLSETLRFALIGSEHCDGTPLDQIAAREGVADQVLHLGPMPHHETLAHLAGSDVLALAGSEGPGSELQIPNKLFEYIALKKPIIATLSAGHPAMGILDSVRATARVGEPGNDEALAEALCGFADPSSRIAPGAFADVSSFSRRFRAAELAEVFERITDRRGRRRRLIREQYSPRANLLQDRPAVFDDVVGPAYR
jgi:glycosyltransferase involved in cell wall biosynthesis